jgi:thiol-disulfide isomerase/thioredoxin
MPLRQRQEVQKMPRPGLTPPARCGKAPALLLLAALMQCPAPSAAAHQLRDWPAERAAPKLELKDRSGRHWSLEALRGRVVVLNFWASWCEPCRKEMPSLAQLARQHPSDAMVVLTVNYKDADPAIDAFLAPLHVDLPVLLDRDGSAASAWTPRVFPTTVLIDKQGRPRRLVLGDVDWGGAVARAWLSELLSADAPNR